MNGVFEYYKNLFNAHGYRLYMVGGTSRDYLLNREINDYDFVSDATPLEILKFLKANDTFKKYGVLKTKYSGINVDIVTLREELEYKDHRHPLSIKFINDINIDYKRRDFTINAIYIDENYKIIDPSSFGIIDLQNRHLRFIGDPLTRIKEDPLRILRAYRFIKEYSLSIDDDVLKLLKENEKLLLEINPNKINEEKKKMEAIKDEIWKFKCIRY